MQFSSIFTLVAVCLSLAAAQTTTSTSTLTKTITITQCNPTATNCPLRQNSTTSSWYPASNSTSSAGPTAAYTNSTIVLPTSTAPAQTSASAPAASTVPTSGASGLLVQSGLLLGVLGAGIAVLA